MRWSGLFPGLMRSTVRLSACMSCAISRRLQWLRTIYTCMSRCEQAPQGHLECKSSLFSISQKEAILKRSPSLDHRKQLEGEDPLTRIARAASSLSDVQALHHNPRTEGEGVVQLHHCLQPLMGESDFP